MALWFMETSCSGSNWVTSPPWGHNANRQKHMLNLHAVLDGRDVPNMHREQSLTGYEASPWIQPLCLQGKTTQDQWNTIKHLDPQYYTFNWHETIFVHWYHVNRPDSLESLEEQAAWDWTRQSGYCHSAGGGQPPCCRSHSGKRQHHQRRGTPPWTQEKRDREGEAC